MPPAHPWSIPATRSWRWVPARVFESFQRIVGLRSDEDLMKAPGDVTFKRVIVTNKPVLGKTVRQLGFEAKYGVSVTRLQRGGLEIMATTDVHLQFGDVPSGRRRASTRTGCG